MTIKPPSVFIFFFHLGFYKSLDAVFPLYSLLKYVRPLMAFLRWHKSDFSLKLSELLPQIFLKFSNT